MRLSILGLGLLVTILMFPMMPPVVHAALFNPEKATPILYVIVARLTCKTQGDFNQAVCSGPGTFAVTLGASKEFGRTSGKMTVTITITNRPTVFTTDESVTFSYEGLWIPSNNPNAFLAVKSTGKWSAPTLNIQLTNGKITRASGPITLENSGVVPFNLAVLQGSSNRGFGNISDPEWFLTGGTDAGGYELLSWSWGGTQT